MAVQQFYSRSIVTTSRNEFQTPQVYERWIQIVDRAGHVIYFKPDGDPFQALTHVAATYDQDYAQRMYAEYKEVLSELARVLTPAPSLGPP